MGFPTKNYKIQGGVSVNGRMLRLLCERKGVKIIEANAYPDYIHMLVSICEFMGYLKGKSSHGNMKNKYGNSQFWCKEHWVDIIGINNKIML